jgi:hypothetical protein
VQLQADELELGTTAGPPQGEDPEVVAQDPVDGVVVEGVAEVVERESTAVALHAMEDVGRVTGH